MTPSGGFRGLRMRPMQLTSGTPSRSSGTSFMLRRMGRTCRKYGTGSGRYRRPRGMLEGLTTERLVLRRWREKDREPFGRLNADPRVMEFMPGCLGLFESDQLIDRIDRHFAAHGF